MQPSKHESAGISVEEKGPMILVDFPGQSLYLQMDTIKETMGWHSVILAAAVNNGLNLDQQQLTRENIPTIIDKCINFVYAHGKFVFSVFMCSIKFEIKNYFCLFSGKSETFLNSCEVKIEVRTSRQKNLSYFVHLNQSNK